MSDIIGIQKAILWEETKGKLRAMWSVSGCHPSTEDRSPDWDRVRERIETFIQEFEDDGLHE